MHRSGRILTALVPGAAIALALGAAVLAPAHQEQPGELKSAWSYAPPIRPEVPDVRQSSWVTNDIDVFILARLEAAGLEPAARADRRTLIRRATYDLIGLPPTPEEVEAFIGDESPDAYERLIDRLLKNPQYGVKWGRHWLDLVRWAETDSYERDRVKPGAWRYRDWVIDALNADMAYDEFVTMQLAGDELPDEGLDQHIATGYLHLGIRDDEPTDPLQAVYDDLDGMLDTTSRVMLGVSMGCARCHNHKKDPISAREYYSMLSFFEGLKPYKVGFGNSINTENFVRSLPADLGTGEWERTHEQWRREREERLNEIANTMEEIRVRWGEQALAGAEASLDEGLVRTLSFDDGSDGPTAGPRDAIENLGDAGIEFVPGRLGGAASFDDEDAILIDRPVQDDFTIAFWMRADGSGSGSDGDPRWFLGSGLVDGEVPGIVDDFGVSLVGTRVGAGVGDPETFIAGPAGTADGAWHHVAFTRERASGRIVLWLDGVEVDSATGGTQALDRPSKLSIGRMLPGYRTFHGALDEIRIYERVLDGREILDLAIGGGALPAHVEIVRQRLGAAEAARHLAAIERIRQLERPAREFVQVLAAQELESPVESFIRVRGMASVKGAPVSPGFPQVLGGGSPSISPPADGESSGRRLALAEWITDPANPRTARVIANRLWQHHFGRGIVRSPNDFGELGELPTHPELLDWLAAELVDGGWRLKRMHKLVMMSSAYRMSSRASSAVVDADPINDLFGRFNPRRLTAEEIRDSILQVNGTLNLEMGGPGVYPKLPEEVLATSSRPDEAWGRSSSEQASRRSIYIHAKRSLLHPMLESFDLADTDLSCPVRFTTTQPTQALTMLNSDEMNGHAAVFVERLREEAGGSHEAMVRRGIELCLQRKALPVEIEEGVQLIADLQEEDGLGRDEAERYLCLVLLNLNEFVYLD